MTFTQKKERIRRLLHSQPTGVDFSSDKVKEIEEFFNNHHTKKYRLKIKRAYVDNHNVGGVMGIQKNIYMDGLSNDERVTKQMCSINHTYSNPTKYRDDSAYEDLRSIQNAMRLALEDSSNDIKEELLPKAVSCPLCGMSFKGVSRGDIHLDHCGEKEFRHIQEDFLIAILEEGQNISCESPSHGHRFVDKQLEARWIEYHNHEATYQLICKQCNLRKSKK